MRNLFPRTFLVTSTAVAALYAGVVGAEDAKLVQKNPVSDIPGLATITDPQLHNPWGVSHSPTSPFWVSNQGTSTATLYAVTDETDCQQDQIHQPASGLRCDPENADGTPRTDWPGQQHQHRVFSGERAVVAETAV